MRTDKPARVLIAGLGNIFLGDDAFGVEVVKRLSRMPLPDDVRLVDVGVRTVHLAYQLREETCEKVILIDTVAKGADPGTLYILEPDPDAPPPAAGVTDGHAVHPHELVALVRQLGGRMPQVVIVGCEPERIGPDAGLSTPVAAAVDGASRIVMRLVSPGSGGKAVAE